ncbi:MAG TPA: ABC transporter ATP-binding protein [Anaerovoracaceae bacterium]|nr:ABC transporter ATP-binding protein [Anaerovoracaceae bacterium]
MSKTKVLEVENLSFSYERNKTLISDICFSIDQGEIFTILGANGSGKSTLLNCINGSFSPKTGSIRLLGRLLSEISIRERAGLMGCVPQISVPTFNFTVRDYIVMGRAPHMEAFEVPKEKEYAIGQAVMERMGIIKLADKLVTQISGGERQQVQIARVLAQESQLIILDEPTNHLDYGNQLRILDILKSLAYEGLSVVLTTHMPDHAILLDGKVGILDQFGQMNVGDVKNTITEETLKRLYNTDLRLLYIREIERVACVAGNIQ